MPWGKTEEQKAREAQERAWAAYVQTPVGKADQAKRAGARFFQVEIPDKSVRVSAAKDQPDAPEVLGQIEALGWHLEHASWIFMQTGQNSTDKLVFSGQTTTVRGEVIGIYLFRNVS